MFLNISICEPLPSTITITHVLQDTTTITHVLQVVQKVPGIRSNMLALPDAYK
jgi:hypothetical protein